MRERELEIAALKFALLSLDVAIKTAGRKKVYDDRRVALPFSEIRLERPLKLAVLKIARDYKIIRYSTANFDDEKNVRVVVIDTKKLNSLFNEYVKEGNVGGSTYAGGSNSRGTNLEEVTPCV